MAPLEKNPTTQQLVKYAGASGDYYQIHYDQEYARANGLPNVILHGALKNAFLGQFMTDWIGERGALKKLSAQYRGMDVPGAPSIARVSSRGSTSRTASTWWSARSGWRTPKAKGPPLDTPSSHYLPAAAEDLAPPLMDDPSSPVKHKLEGRPLRGLPSATPKVNSLRKVCYFSGLPPFSRR